MNNLKINMVVLSVLLLGACSNYSNLSKNLIKNGTFILKGGVKNKKVWKTDLHFNRVSWYHELTLFFDLLHTKLESNSPFNSWLSSSEKEIIEDCTDHLITLSYALDSQKISHKDLVNQLSDHGYKEFILPTFFRNLRLHPDFDQVSFNLYKIHGFCRKGPKKGELFLNFPGFEENIIK